MKHFLFKAVLAHNPRIEISGRRYAAIIEAWDAVFNIVKIEEEWDNLVQSFLELERDLLSTALDEMVLDDSTYVRFNQNRLLFSRRLSNFLHAARCYLDHTPHHLGKLALSGAAEAFKGFTSQAYDDHFGYRFMEALRNYAQHRGVPLHGTTYDASWVEHDGERKGLMRHSVTAAIHLDEIKTDAKFKPSILKEIGSDLEKLDVATMTREYVEALNGAHLALRATFQAALAGWIRTVRDAISLYAAESNGNLIALAVGRFEDARIPIERTHIHDDMLKRVEWLMRRNGNLVNLRRRFVTNAISAR